MSVVLPIRLSASEKKKAMRLAKRRGIPLGTYIKTLIQREAGRPGRFDIGGASPKLPSRPPKRATAYERD